MKQRLKTKSSAKKRFRVSKNGKVKFAHAFGSHNFLNKKQNRKRKYRKGVIADSTSISEVARMLPYGRP